MKTVAQRLDSDSSALRASIGDLLGPDKPYRDVNTPSSSVVLIGASYAYPDLPLQQKRLQSRLVQQHRRFFAMARSLLAGQSSEAQKQLDQNEKSVREVIEQESLSWHRSSGEALKAVDEALSEVRDSVSHLDDPAEGSILLVPDTNALIASPSLPDWSFVDISRFQILLVPTLLSELDSLKVEHRSPKVKEKAQSVIRQIKEFGRRGSLEEGVCVVSGRIGVRSFAREPDVTNALPWLDATVPDDRILASTVEAMRFHPRSVVALVTGDINLQNKAAFAGIEFLEPPGGV